MSVQFVKPASTRDRILDALIACVADSGFSRVSMEQIAGRAGLSRVTLYAYFANRQAIVQAAALRELARFFEHLESLADAEADPQRQLVNLWAHALLGLRGHVLIQRMMRAEPELLSTYAARQTPAIPFARAWVAGKLAEAGGLAPGTSPEQAAEFIVRSIHSLVLAPDSAFELDSIEHAREHAQRWVAPPLFATAP